MKDEQLKYLIGFTISRTIDVERSIISFITKYYCNDPKIISGFHELISEHTFNKKIDIFLKIIKQSDLKFVYANDLIPNLEKIRKIRNYFAHESFSYDDEEKKYYFLNLKMRLQSFTKEEIENHWELCRKVIKEITKLRIQIKTNGKV